MQTQTRADPGCTTRPKPDTASPHEIATVIDHLAARIKADGNGDIFGLWAVATLASKLGITTGLSASTDPVEVIEDLGFWWRAAISTALDEHPDRVADILKAGMTVIQKIVADVRKRGLAG